MSDTPKRDRLIRRLVPSLVPLSHRRAFTGPLDVADKVISSPFSEFRELPPNRYRIRVGTGNRIVFNQAYFLIHSANVAMRLFALGLAKHDSAILDIGCGCGRLALALRNADVFEGTYTGIDVDSEMVAWCNENLADSRYRFLHADIYNELYNPGGSRDPYEIPLADSSHQLVTSNSLFTHLLDEDMDHYIAESCRVLDGGGHMAMSVFCIEDMRAREDLQSRWTFEHRVGNAFVESLEEPEAAVAYARGDLERRAREAGFAEARVRAYEPQSLLVARR